MPLFSGSSDAIIQMIATVNSSSGTGQVWYDGTNLNMNIGGSVYKLAPNVIPTFSQTVVTRSLNSAFTPSSTNDMYVNYSISIGTTISLTTGAQGTVFLQISPTGSVWTTICSFTNGQTGTLTIGLNLSQTVGGILCGTVPLGYQVKLVTTNNTGTPTFTYVTGQESTTI